MGLVFVRFDDVNEWLGLVSETDHEHMSGAKSDIAALTGGLALNQGHEGKIYQASNWLFVGMTGYEASIMLNGKLTHRRTINSKYGTSDIDWLRKRIDPNATRHEGKPKFKYLLPLDDEMAERTRSLSKPYPERCATSETSDTPGIHPGEGRAARTVALQRSITAK